MAGILGSFLGGVLFEKIGYAKGVKLVDSSVSVPVIAIISEQASYLTAWIVIAAAIVLIVGLHLKCIREGDRLKGQFTEYK